MDWVTVWPCGCWQRIRVDQQQPGDHHRCDALKWLYMDLYSVDESQAMALWRRIWQHRMGNPARRRYYIPPEQVRIPWHLLGWPQFAPLQLAARAGEAVRTPAQPTDAQDSAVSVVPVQKPYAEPVAMVSEMTAPVQLGLGLEFAPDDGPSDGYKRLLA